MLSLFWWEMVDCLEKQGARTMPFRGSFVQFFHFLSLTHSLNVYQLITGNNILAIFFLSNINISTDKEEKRRRHNCGPLITRHADTTDQRAGRRRRRCCRTAVVQYYSPEQFLTLSTGWRRQWMEVMVKNILTIRRHGSEKHRKSWSEQFGTPEQQQHQWCALGAVPHSHFNEKYNHNL